MDELLKLLQIEGVSTTGIMLAVLVAFVVALHKEWVVTGARFTAQGKDLTTCHEASKAAITELRNTSDDLIEYRIAYERCVTEREHGWTSANTRSPKRSPTPRRKPS